MLPDVGRMAAAAVDQGGFVGAGEVPARRDEKGAASHRRVGHSELEDLVRRLAAKQRRERLSDQMIGNRLRRVEGPGGLANA